MADGVWKGVIGCSRQLLPNKCFDPSTPSMRKVDDGEKKKTREKNGENSGPLTLLPVDRLTATDCNADARAKRKKKKKKKNNGGNSGH